MIALRVIRHLLYLVLVFILQMTWLHYLDIFGIQPDLILLAIVFIALTSGHLEATALGFLAGFCQDTYSPADLGLNALAKSCIGFAVGLGRTRIMADTLQVQVLVLMGAVGVHDLIYYLGQSGVSVGQVPYYLLRYTLGRAVFTALFGAAVAVVLQARRQYEGE